MKNYIRACAKISKAALLNNISEVRKNVPENTLVMPVIKADAYGHNADLVSKVLEPYADYFAVAIIEEAISLRNSGVQKPIMLLGYTSPGYFDDAIKNNITVTVFTLDDAKKLSDTAVNLNMTATVHVAIDTGMSRIGFACTDKSILDIKEISKLSNIKLEGIFTHFATADEENRAFTNLQAEKFAEFINKLEKEGVNIPIKHCSNSAAIIEYPCLALNMVRMGIITYGLYPSDAVDRSKILLKPVLEFTSSVAYVKNIYKGDSVSYGRAFIAEKEMTVATIPIGYADGYPRILSNKGRVLVNGKYAPILGRICMDQFMIDVSGIEGVKAGDKVTLIGAQGENDISADEIARLSQTINYEIVCGIGKRVPRRLEE